jgi:hypothetical protein
MEYERVLIIEEETGEPTYQLISQIRQPVDIDRSRRPMTSRIRISTRTRRTARYITIPKVTQSPRQDALTPGNYSRSRGPKTRGGNNEFISAFWVNGKPKCRIGYRYDFNRKMCRLVK